MKKHPKKSYKPTSRDALKGWKQIAAVHREGRFVATSPEELNARLGEESGKPVHAAVETTDLTAELKRGLSYVRNEKQPKSAKQRVRKRTS
jgi:hypothetical protein